jgi:signal transduction histidine kinase
MKERVEKLGGKFSLRSAPSNGTEVAVWLPAPIAYATSSFAAKIQEVLFLLVGVRKQQS